MNLNTRQVQELGKMEDETGIHRVSWLKPGNTCTSGPPQCLVTLHEPSECKAQIALFLAIGGNQDLQENGILQNAPVNQLNRQNTTIRIQVFLNQWSTRAESRKEFSKHDTKGKTHKGKMKISDFINFFFSLFKITVTIKPNVN